MAPAVVVRVGVPPGNFTAVEVSVPNVAVLDPDPSCVIITVTDPPAGRLAMTKPVFTPNVTVCTDARAQFTVMVELLVSELIFSV